jgi:hypothetical protein
MQIDENLESLILSSYRIPADEAFTAGEQTRSVIHGAQTGVTKAPVNKRIPGLLGCVEACLPLNFGNLFAPAPCCGKFGGFIFMVLPRTYLRRSL